MENQLYGYMVFECFFSMRNRDPWDDGDDDDDDDDDDDGGGGGDGEDNDINNHDNNNKGLPRGVALDTRLFTICLNPVACQL